MTKCGNNNETAGTHEISSHKIIEYNMSKDEMLDILEELVQGEHIWRLDKNDLLNFLSEIREQQPSITFLEKLHLEHPEIELDLTIKAYTSCPCAFGYEDYKPSETCDAISCVECWLRKC